MKKFILFIVLFIAVLTFSSCTVTSLVQDNEEILLSIDFTEEDIIENGFDLEDFSTKRKFTEYFNEQIKDLNEYNVDVTLSWYLKKTDGYFIRLKVKPSESLDEGFENGIAIDAAQDVLDKFAQNRYGLEYEDSYEYLLDEIDIGSLTVLNKRGRVLTKTEADELFSELDYEQLRAEYCFTQYVDKHLMHRIFKPKFIIVSETNDYTNDLLMMEVFGKDRNMAEYKNGTLTLDNGNMFLMVYKKNMFWRILGYIILGVVVLAILLIVLTAKLICDHP